MYTRKYDLEEPPKLDEQLDEEGPSYKMQYSVVRTKELEERFFK